MIGLRDQSGELAHDLWCCRKRANALGPLTKVAGAQRWLRRMIKHQSQVGRLDGQGGRRRQLVGQDKEVVAQATLCDLVEAAANIPSQQPPWIGLVLHQVPDTDQQLPARNSSQPVELASHPGVGQVHPANDAGYERISLCKTKEFLTFRPEREALHEDCCR